MRKLRQIFSLLALLPAACSTAPPAQEPSGGWGLGSSGASADGTTAHAPPSYASPSRYRELDLFVGEGARKLRATLTRPRDDRGCPGLVLVHGSGSSDRDATLGPNKPFRDLALGLASRGICVLRYDKRRFGRKASDLTEETIDDALSAAALLRRQPGIEKVFVLGHSLGGRAIPRIARRDAALDGFVILGGSTQPLEQSLLLQMEHLVKLDGEVSDKERAILDDIRRRADNVAALARGGDVGELPLGLPRSYWLDLAAHPPAEEIASERRPVLVLHAGRDYQVTERDFEGWRSALAAHPDATFQRFPNLNHLFMAGEGTSHPSEYQRPGQVAQSVVEAVATWIRARR